ncbi:globin domain-containing protein [Flavihumibacter petaseus]|uniref:Putative globin-like protein n=1 Tax=Flavihumibacter petaseus NBRC 106054 TaxID=1220578 RepID=A0A0E9MYQ4_9BACT|nr:globin domain-containing protein [Flavihumibacter petaseus]GAO42546.1 putative globin-like protein [Flavihumibacter petaseus NBRC 106054]
MTKEAIRLVQQTWVTVIPVSQTLGEAFYRKLFTAEPLVKHLFKTDIKEQACKLTQMFTHIISHLDRLEDVRGDLHRLGQRHNQYKVKPEYYAIVGESLIATLEQQLGEKWTGATKAAWIDFLTIVFEAMMQGQGNYIWPFHLDTGSERN